MSVTGAPALADDCLGSYLARNSVQVITLSD